MGPSTSLLPFTFLPILPKIPLSHLVLFYFLPVILGSLPFLLTAPRARPWTKTLIKSKLSPRGSFQAIIWSLNLLLLGHITYQIYILPQQDILQFTAYLLLGLQLVLCGTWAVCCLGCRRVDWGLTCIVLLSACVAACATVLGMIDDKLVGWFCGVVGWTVHCLYLNIYLVVHNCGRTKKVVAVW